MAHSDLFIINIAIASMNRPTERILDVINGFQNTNVSIHERVRLSPPPYYINWFVSVHHPIITTGLKALILMFL